MKFQVNYGNRQTKYSVLDKVAKMYSADLQDGKNDFTMIYQPAIDELLGNLFGKRILLP